MFKVTQITSLAVALCLAASTAFAGTATLTAPMQGATLHEDQIDMSIYYLDHQNHFEVVAAYVVRGGDTEPRFLRMGLVDGDDVSFGLPGHGDFKFRFVRDRDTVSVTSEPTKNVTALN